MIVVITTVDGSHVDGDNDGYNDDHRDDGAAITVVDLM